MFDIAIRYRATNGLYTVYKLHSRPRGCIDTCYSILTDELSIKEVVHVIKHVEHQAVAFHKFQCNTFIFVDALQSYAIVLPENMRKNHAAMGMEMVVGMSH